MQDRARRENAVLRAIFSPQGVGTQIIRGDLVTTESRAPLAGFGWLQRGISVGFRHPKPVFGGAIILLLIVMVPSLAMLPFQLHGAAVGTPPNPALFVAFMAASMVLGLLVVPLYAGYLQVFDAIERGLPARAIDIFNPYRQGDALRLIGYGLALVVIYFALAGIIVLAAGDGIVSWYMQVLGAQANHVQPPGLPQGFGIVLALLTVMGLFMMGFYSVSLGQIALRRRGVLNALGDGFLGALKNLLPLIVLAVSLVIAWIIAVIALVIVVFAFALLGALVGKWLMFALIVPVYIALGLVIFAVMFGVMYYLWRDVCGGDTTSNPTEALAA